MRFAVFGAGAIGAYVGAALARGGADVVLIARGPHLRAMQERGVTVLSNRGDFHAHPRATDDVDAIAEADVVFVGLKAYSLTGIAPELGRALGTHATVIGGQNGIPWWYFQSHGGPLEGTALETVDPGGTIARSIPPEQVVGCVAFPATAIVKPGVVQHIEGTRFAIGEPDGSVSERCSDISEAFVAGGFKCPVEERLRDQIWLKLVGNAVFNPLSALTGATLGELGRVPQMVKVLRAAFEECANVASALEIGFPVSLERRLEAGFAVGDHKTSMLQDLEAGKPLEYECMTGAVVELAQRLDVSVPHLETIYGSIKLLDTVRASGAEESPNEG